ncbi:MAG: 4-hydroxy-tetrahydrodipicolinate synthase [Desulfovibrionales bacterium]
MQFQGALTALVTPFRNNEVDEDAYRAHVEWQIEQGIDGLVPCGTTGESATLSHDEHKKVISICVDQAKGRVPILAGAGSNNTSEAIDLAGYAKDAGADGVLLITPYYNKPTQEGLFEHFKAIAAEVSLPSVVYNVPGRTGVNVLPATMARMFREIPEVIGVKEATGDLKQVSEVIEYCGPDFLVLSGDDFTVLPLLSLGGQGVISVVSNIAPAKMAGLCSAYAKKDLEKAKALHFELSPLSRAMFIETNPMPVKTSLHLMGRSALEMRLPLVPMQPENRAELERILRQEGLMAS